MAILRKTALACASLCCCGLIAGSVLAHVGMVDERGCHFLAKPRGEHCHKNRAARHAVPEAASESLRRNEQASQQRRRVDAARLRHLYRYWNDADGDCQNTYTEVLIRESLEEPLLSEDGCRVVRGQWRDPYSGGVFTDPGQVRVVHLVPVREVHVSGGHRWDEARRTSYANDLSDPKTLAVVYWREKKDRGSKSPADWLPSNRTYRCKYVRSWVQVKKRWKLTADAAEKKAVGRVLKACRRDR